MRKVARRFAVGGGNAAKDRDWKILLDEIDQGEVVPILGHDVLGDAYRDLARELADELEMAELAQDVGVAWDPEAATLASVWESFIRWGGPEHEVYDTLKELVDDDQRPVPKALRELAEIMPLRLFVTTTVDPWMKMALEAAGRGVHELLYEPNEQSQDLPEDFEEQTIAQENWNERWEESITPIVVGPFLIAPTWAEVPVANDKTLLRIDPKMSFGTGYHASTRLVLHFLPGLVRGSIRMLDAGTGTGILAIAALKLGAATVLGFDVDPWSVTNAEESAALNGVADRFEIREGGIESIPEDDFDLIVANINRNTLGTMLPELAEKLTQDGRLALAGLLQTDRDDMVQAIHEVNLTLYDEATEDEWWSAVCERA